MHAVHLHSSVLLATKQQNKKGKNMKKLFLTTAAVAAIATPAFADNMYGDNQTGIDRTFTGPYIGVYGGYGWNNLETAGGADASVDGGDYGIYAGFKADTLLDNTVNRLGLGLTGAVEVYYGL